MSLDQLACILDQFGYWLARSEGASRVFMNRDALPKLRILPIRLDGDWIDDPTYVMDFLSTRGFDRDVLLEAFARCVGNRS